MCFVSYENHKIYKQLYLGTLGVLVWGFDFWVFFRLNVSFPCTKAVLHF